MVSATGPRLVSLPAQFMAELALLIKLGPRSRINAIDQTQRSVYALPKDFMQAWNTFTTEYPEIWVHLSNRDYYGSPYLRSTKPLRSMLQPRLATAT